MLTKDKLGFFLIPEHGQNNSITSGTSKVRQSIGPLILPNKQVLSRGSVDMQWWTFTKTMHNIPSDGKHRQ